MKNQIPYGRQDIDDQDVAAVMQVLKSDFLTQGPSVAEFETNICNIVRAKYGVAMNSATSALHVACLALSLGPEDILWTVPNSFVASANCGLYCGAKIDFVDIDKLTHNLCVKDLKTKLEEAELKNCLPKILLVVHFAGEPCDMQTIYNLCQKYDIKLIEDASHAIGARYCGEPVGNCRYSDITIFSFHPVKIITTGEGGLATTNNPELWQKMNLFRSHGITRDPSQMNQESEGAWYYQQIDLGYNYRMTDLQAALGSSQLRKLESFLQKRHALATRYDQLLADLPVILPLRNPNNFSALHLYVIGLAINNSTSLDENSRFRAKVFASMREQGIGVNVHYIPIYKQPYYASIGKYEGRFNNSEFYYSQCLTLPLFASLSESEQDYVVSSLKKSLR